MGTTEIAGRFPSLAMEERVASHVTIKTVFQRLLQNDYLILVVRAVLGLLFIIASVDKIADPASFAKAIEHYKLLSPGLSLLAATILPWIELFCGLCIFFGLFERGAALLSLVLLLFFTTALFVALLRHLDISCGCFSRDPSTEKISWTKVIENCGWICLSLFLLYAKKTRYSVESLLEYLRNQK
ncbi:MAG: MauE/DoxX family redox-associated membrane protein [bacterium]